MMNKLSLQPYPAYKPSGIEWLGDIPAHWGVRRLKQVCSESALYGANVPAIQYQDTGVRFLRTSDITDDGGLRDKGVFVSKSLVKDYILEDGDVLLSRSGTIGRSFLYSSDLHGECSYAGYLVRFVPNSAVLPDYVFMFTKTQAFDAFLRLMSISSTIENLNGEKYANAYLPLPPLPEQRAIAQYLDRADHRIQQYLAAKERLAQSLTEYRQALINQAVTRGLDPNAPMKPSGLDWLGDVPAHWEIRRLKTLCRMKSGDGITAESIEATGEYPVYGGNGLRGYASSYTHDGAYALIGRQGALCGNVHIVRGRFWASEHAVVAILCDGYDIDWFGGILTAMNLNQYSMSAAQPGLSVERIMNLALPVPPKPEQKRIATRITRAAEQTDAAVATVHRQVELMREYRNRLLSDVVTGRIDVRNNPDGSHQREMERVAQ